MNLSRDPLRSALLRADPLLSRYDPLDRILCLDHFEEGFHGWQVYFPDYDGLAAYPGKHPDIDPLGDIRQQSLGQPDLRVDRKFPLGPRAIPMISSLTSWDVGTAGAWDSCYALKIPTLPQPGHKGFVVKRLGSPWRGKFRIEAWFTYKAEPGDFRLGESDVHSFFVACDVMESHAVRQAGRVPRRWWPSMRYLNCEKGELIGRWQANFSGGEGVMSGPWSDLPEGRQDLGFNRSPTKYQWHYLRFTFDLASCTYLDFRCADQEYDVAGRTHDPKPALSPARASTDHCPGLVNVSFGIETNSRKRCFLYLNSVVVSATDS